MSGVKSVWPRARKLFRHAEYPNVGRPRRRTHRKARAAAVAAKPEQLTVTKYGRRPTGSLRGRLALAGSALAAVAAACWWLL